ncbi:unnamed protein product [Mycena citricolor]|uniref:NAD(P)-binding protein n=1 Tax=Mycena citricolor TaxID=2018698 RepID=A0AAD2GVD2_9AGAR|nr:unnamed protein product [Mycena citricolor]CAK5264867.1 unnamed protein product [Mycena citricolor]
MATSIDQARCILVVGATSGIGRALALAISELPSKPTVIAAGRRADRLAELTVKGLKTVQLDVTEDDAALKTKVDALIAQYPTLDGVLLCSGIQYQQNFLREIALSDVKKEVQVNYMAVITLITMFLPHFLKLSGAGLPSWIIPVSSGLGLLPSSQMPNYCATKAALRSFTISLRRQLLETKVSVIEIIPPLVESELHDDQGTTAFLSKIWMPLADYTAHTLKGLREGKTDIGAGTSEKDVERFIAAGLNAPVPVRKFD